MSIHESIAESIDHFAGILRCSVCGRWEWMTGSASFLANGWPKCHGYTMSWITNNLIATEGWTLNEETLEWLLLSLSGGADEQ